MICECLDYVNFMLTGLWVGSRMNATCKWNYDSVAGRFHDALFDELGVPDPAARLPAEIHAVGAPVAPVSAAAAEHLGLANRRPILAQGGIDAHIGMVGAGTMAPGELLMIGGTSVVHLFQLPAQAPVTGFWGPYPHALVDDHWLVEAGQVSAGSVLSWFSGEVFRLDAAGLEALWRGGGGAAGRRRGPAHPRLFHGQSHALSRPDAARRRARPVAGPRPGGALPGARPWRVWRSPPPMC